MTDVNDAQNYENTYENQLEKLGSADIAEADREAIRGFVRHADANGEIETGTIINHLNRLRLSAERWDRPLVETTSDKDLDALRFSLKHEHNLKDGTLRNYEKAWRKFFDWQDVEWAEDISIHSSPKRKVDPEMLLTKEEIDELPDATNHVRDKAALALLGAVKLRTRRSMVRMLDVRIRPPQRM